MQLNAAHVYVQIGQPEKALEYYLELLRNHDPAVSGVTQSFIYSRIGLAYGKMNNISKAKENLEKALETIDEEERHSLLGSILNNIGECYRKENDYETAISYFRRTVEMDVIESSWGIAHLNMALSFFEQKKMDSTLVHLEKATKIFLGLNPESPDLLQCYELYTDFYNAAQNYEEAIRYQTLRVELNEILTEKANVKKITELQIQYNIEKIQEESRHKIELVQREAEADKIFNYSLGTIAIIIIIFLIYYIRAKQKANAQKLALTLQKQENLKVEIDHKNNELTFFASFILKRNSFLKELKSAVDKLSTDREEKKPVLSLINQNLSIDEDRKEFQMHAERLQQSFYYTLQAKFPQLTDSEVKIACLMLVKLSSKELADILNMSIRAVEQKRYLLRKKMNIDAKTDITKFLNDIISKFN